MFIVTAGSKLIVTCQMFVQRCFIKLNFAEKVLVWAMREVRAALLSHITSRYIDIVCSLVINDANYVFFCDKRLNKTLFSFS